MKKRLYIVKIGGNIIDDEEKLNSFLQAFAQIPDSKLLVHGGGKLATELAHRLGIPQQLIEGRRVTDPETLKVATMVYGGFINKSIVAKLQGFSCNAIGLTGADGNVVEAHKRIHATIDYGYVGDIDKVNNPFIETLLNEGLSPVMAPITHDSKGQLLNTNADTVAQELATALSQSFSISLIYSFEKKGVLLDINDDDSVLKKLNAKEYYQLKTAGKIFAGMIPKLDNAFQALDRGVEKVIIGRAEELQDLINGISGTTITHE